MATIYEMHLQDEPFALILSGRKTIEMRLNSPGRENISKGDKLTKDNLTYKKPGTGIIPSEIEQIVGKIAIVDILKGSIIDFEMFEK